MTAGHEPAGRGAVPLSIRPPTRPAAAASVEALDADAGVSAPVRAPGWWHAASPPGDKQQQQAAVLLWHFNCHIASLAHPSWIERPAWTNHPATSAHLLARHGLTGCHEWHCRAEAQRLWLIDSASLAALTLSLGGLAQAPRLHRRVRGEQRLALRGAWPALAWEAAHDLLAPRLDLPAADASEAASTGDEATLSDALARLGAQLLRGLLAPEWRAFVGRARLRLPRAWADDPPRALQPETQRALVRWITAVWVPQRSPAWAWLF
jgi:hypothetical protein